MPAAHGVCGWDVGSMCRVHSCAADTGTWAPSHSAESCTGGYGSAYGGASAVAPRSLHPLQHSPYFFPSCYGSYALATSLSSRTCIAVYRLLSVHSQNVRRAFGSSQPWISSPQYDGNVYSRDLPSSAENDLPIALVQSVWAALALHSSVAFRM